MQLQSSTLYGPGLLCSTCALSWVDIGGLVATATWWQCCWKITRHYGTEMLSILVWDRRRKPQREERLFETQFHHGEDSIISKGRHFVSFKIQPGEIRALWYFCRPPLCCWKYGICSHTTQGAPSHPGFSVMWWQFSHILFLGSFNFLTSSVEWSLILTIFSIKDLKNICSLEVQYRTDWPPIWLLACISICI